MIINKLANNNGGVNKSLKGWKAPGNDQGKYSDRNGKCSNSETIKLSEKDMGTEKNASRPTYSTDCTNS